MSVIVGKEIVELNMRRSLVILLVLGGAFIEALPMPTELKSFESNVDSKEVNPEDSDEVNPEETDEVNPEETGDYLDGDIVMPLVLTMRNGLNIPNRQWPNAVVPYEIEDNFKANDLANIEDAMARFHYNTCIRFVPRSNQTDYISIGNNRTGCWSTVGRKGGKQIVNLQTPKCTRKPGTVMHELNHALGFLHEQNRSERDDYVIVQYNNIHPKRMINFRKFNNTQNFGIPYDYSSIMHYSSKAFSSNGQDTLVPKVGVLSFYDLNLNSNLSSIFIFFFIRTAKLGKSSHGSEEKIDSTRHRKN